MRDNVIDCRVVDVGLVIWRKANSKIHHLYRRTFKDHNLVFKNGWETYYIRQLCMVCPSMVDRENLSVGNTISLQL